MTIDPANGGGVLHSLLAYKSILEKHCSDVTIFFLSFSPEISWSLKRAKFFSQILRGDMFGSKFVAIGSRYAFYEPWHYSATKSAWEAELKGFDRFFVTSGTAIAAHPLAMLNKKYSVSFASDFASDRQFLEYPNLFRRGLARISFPAMGSIEKECLANAHRLLPMSGYAKKQSQTILGHSLAQKSCDVAGYPIFVNLPAVHSGPKEHGTFVSIGRFKDRRKNVSLLLAAWRIVSARFKFARLILIGQAPEPEALDCYKDLIHSGSIKIMQGVSAKEKFHIIQKSTALIISSEQEGLGITGLEAAVCKTAVISTDCGGPSDYIIDNQTGFFVPRGNAEAMAQKVIDLLEDRDLAAEIGANLYEFVLTNFATEKIEKTIVQGLI